MKHYDIAPFLDVIKTKIFSQCGNMDNIKFYDSITVIVIIYSVPYLTMSIIRAENNWTFNIKFSVKKDQDFITTLKCNGFVFKDEFKDYLEKCSAPLDKQKNLFIEKSHIDVEHTVEHLFYFTKQNELENKHSSCTYIINDSYLYFKITEHPSLEITYDYTGYHGNNMVTQKYEFIPDYEFCLLYLKNRFNEQGLIAVANDINHNNFNSYFELLNMTEI